MPRDRPHHFRITPVLMRLATPSYFLLRPQILTPIYAFPRARWATPRTALPKAFQTAGIVLAPGRGRRRPCCRIGGA
jgi:hypothetical protein